MKIKKNDTVLVLTGKDNGKTGKVLVVSPKTNKITVDGINIQKKHRKARSANQTSEIVEQCGPIDASNVEVVCPACGKATRVSYGEVNGKKVRLCKKCGAGLDVEAKKAKKESKKDSAKKDTAKKETAKKTTTTKRTRTKKTAEETADKAE